MASLWASPLLATSVIPIADAELYQRADVIVHGVVLSSDVTVDGRGRPETVTVIEPMAVLKGQLGGSLVLHQLGGTLPDGRFFKLWGRPEYAPGREVVVFAIARPEGEYETAEMLLGKFEVWQDETGSLFAVPDLAAGVHAGVEIRERPQALRHAREENRAGADANGNSGGPRAENAPQDERSPRALAPFLASLRTGVFEESPSAMPSGSLEPVHHAETSERVSPQWGTLADSLYRWNNNATATWTISGTANMDGGGIAEAQGALASWTNDPHSTINYVPGGGTSNVIYLNQTSSILGCGWSTCLSGGGVIGCGGPTGIGGSNTWRGETYTNISQAVAELRAACSFNGFGSVITQSVLTHELGHTLGLGHSDQNVSTHDICRGDEDAATMRSFVQNRITLGTDDQDAIRWLYGDGGSSCAQAPAPSVTGVTPATSVTTGGTPITITGANFQPGATVSIGGVAATNVTIVTASSMTATTGAHGVGPATVVVSNPDGQSGSLPGFAYVSLPPAAGDFNGDGKMDILLRNSATGQNAAWLMNGVAFAGIVDLPALPNANYRNEGVGDFNGDGKMDIVWRNSTTGQNAVWLMNGTSLMSIVDLPALSNTNYHIEAIGDFNGDGKPDIVLRNYATGQNAVWLMNGTAYAGTVDLPALSNVNYRIEGVGDFNGDGKMDIVWRNYATGQDAVWLMNGTTLMSIVDLPALTNVNYRFDAVADYNGDGKPDIVLRNYATGQNAIWVMNGTTLSTIVDLPGLTNTNWEIAGPK